MNDEVNMLFTLGRKGWRSVPLHYILKGQQVIPAAGVLAWGRWFETSQDRFIRATHVRGIFVSTVFIGVDMGFPPDPHAPRVFETGVFKRGHMEHCARNATYAEAVMVHKVLVRSFRTSRRQLKKNAQRNKP